MIVPFLGAIPDGAIILFSGLKGNAQQTLDIGMGALTGSTVMLICVPWFTAIYFGRVNLNSVGEPIYSRPVNAPADWRKVHGLTQSHILNPVSMYDVYRCNPDSNADFRARQLLRTLFSNKVSVSKKACGTPQSGCGSQCSVFL